MGFLYICIGNKSAVWSNGSLARGGLRRFDSGNRTIAHQHVRFRSRRVAIARCAVLKKEVSAKITAINSLRFLVKYSGVEQE